MQQPWEETITTVNITERKQRILEIKEILTLKEHSYDYVKPKTLGPEAQAYSIIPCCLLSSIPEK